MPVGVIADLAQVPVSSGLSQLPAELLDAVQATGISGRSWLLATVRTLPTLLLVPAFGLQALPVAVRIIWAVALAAAALPMSPVSSGVPSAWPSEYAIVHELAFELLAGLPVAVGASVLVWVSLMVGGITDRVLATRGRYALVETEAGPFATLFALAACYGFLRFGGVTFFAERLGQAQPLAAPTALLERVVADLVASIGLAVAVACPVLIAALTLDVALLGVGRAFYRSGSSGVTAPARTLALLVLLYLMMPLIGQALALAFDFEG